LKHINIFNRLGAATPPPHLHDGTDVRVLYILLIFTILFSLTKVYSSTVLQHNVVGAWSWRDPDFSCHLQKRIPQYSGPKNKGKICNNLKHLKCHHNEIVTFIHEGLEEALGSCPSTVCFCVSRWTRPLWERACEPWTGIYICTPHA